MEREIERERERGIDRKREREFELRFFIGIKLMNNILDVFFLLVGEFCSSGNKEFRGGRGFWGLIFGEWFIFDWYLGGCVIIVGVDL